MKNYEDFQQNSNNNTKPKAFLIRDQNKSNTNWKPKNYQNNYPSNFKFKNLVITKFDNI